MKRRKASLVILRHGQSEWNKQNIFTGWVDIPLSLEGIQEALEAGKKIHSIPFSVVFVSTLVRSQMTALLALSEQVGGKTPLFVRSQRKEHEGWEKIFEKKVEEGCLPIVAAWELNERMYGELQGVNKEEARKQYGKEQVHIWRRSYDIPPPGGESLQQTAARTIPYFQQAILPYLERGENVLISAHGNSLRAIVMVLDKLSKDEVLQLEIPTGKPIGYCYDKGNWIKQDVKDIQSSFQKEGDN